MITVVSASAQRRIFYVAAVTAALIVAFLATANISQAKAENWSGHLPAKTWGARAVFQSLSFISAGTGSGLGICTTAAEFSGGWSFPYGWSCGVGSTVWTHSPSVGGYPAVDNPNSQEISYGAEAI